MNKNELKQFELFESLVLKANKNNDIFFGAIKVLKTKEPYDVVVEFDGYKKYVQLTTMSNVVATLNNKNVHTNKMNLNLSKSFYKKNRHEEINFLKKNNIDRKIIKHTPEYLFVSDNFNHTNESEVDFDKKYNVNTTKLINAIYRIIKKKNKKSTYTFTNKKEKSILVILDESNNIFNKVPIIKFINANTSEINKIKSWTILDYFQSILGIALKEIKLISFFDAVQVYFHQASSSDSDECFYFANNVTTPKYDIKHITNLQITPLCMKLACRIATILK